MSLLVAYILDSGIVFAADRNVTQRIGSATTQQPGRKVFRAPAADALVGYVGAADTAAGISMDMWLSDFLSRNSPVSNPEETAKKLQTELQRVMRPKVQSIVQFAAFTDKGGVRVPQYWHISNIHGMSLTTGRYDPATDSFGCSEEFLSKCNTVGINNIRGYLKKLADGYNPLWFHQSIDILIFNELEEGAKQAIRVLQIQKLLTAPMDLSDWEQHARYWVLLFGAYYEAFHRAGHQFVGGGAEVVSIPWP